MPKKVRKGVEISEEERLVQQQQRSQAEEEMAKKKKETLTLYLQDKLQKEQRNTAVNVLKLNESWRKNLRQTRDAELRKDMNVLQQTFERQQDELNAVIKKLGCDLQEAEHQENLVWQTHLQHVDCSCHQQTKRVMSLHQLCESSLQDLSSMCSSEKKKMLTEFEEQQHKICEYRACLSSQNEEKMTEIHKFYENVLLEEQTNEENTKAPEESTNLDVLQKNLDQNLQSLQLTRIKMKEAVNCISQMKQKISTDVCRMGRMKGKKTQLEKQVQSSKAEYVLMEQSLKAAEDQVNQKCHKLRDQVVRDQQATRKKLTNLIIQSDAVKKNLQPIIIKGEKVLRVAELCQKLEDKREASHFSTVCTEEDTQEFCEFKELQQRLNVALLDREALRNHQRHLSRENKQLERLLLQHVNNPEGHHNPLMVSHAPTFSIPPARCQTLHVSSRFKKFRK